MDVLKTLCLFLLFDIIYLFLLRGSYIKVYFSRFGDRLSVWYGLGAWILLAIGLQYFVIDASINKNEVFYKGLLFGLVVYGVYDFTNMATIKNWTLDFLLQDMIWGMLLCATIAYLRK